MGVNEEGITKPIYSLTNKDNQGLGYPSYQVLSMISLNSSYNVEVNSNDVENINNIVIIASFNDLDISPLSTNHAILTINLPFTNLPSFIGINKAHHHLMYLRVMKHSWNSWTYMVRFLLVLLNQYLSKS